MKLASSSYYYQPTTDLDERDRRDAELRDQIERLQREFPGYGIIEPAEEDKELLQTI
jgi:hypothetical protein